MKTIFKLAAPAIFFAISGNVLAADTGSSFPNGYFKMTTQFRESNNECLEGNQIKGSMNGAAFMDKCQNVSGQSWKATPAGNGYFKLTTKFREGNNECLEGNQVKGSMNGAAFMDKCQAVSGQLWKATPAGNGYFKLTTQFRESQNECFEGNQVKGSMNGAAFMDKCQAVSGQLWKFNPEQTAAASNSAKWVAASNGDIPSGSLVSGNEANGENLYVCRANYQGGVHPGKIRKAFGGCNIGWGGKEIAVKQYETYVIGGQSNNWKQANNGEVPPSAVVAGQESDGTKLYICRGRYEGGIHSGKIRNAFGACNISWGGNEVKVNPYEVFVQ